MYPGGNLGRKKAAGPKDYYNPSIIPPHTQVPRSLYQSSCMAKELEDLGSSSPTEILCKSLTSLGVEGEH